MLTREVLRARKARSWRLELASVMTAGAALGAWLSTFPF